MINLNKLKESFWLVKKENENIKKSDFENSIANEIKNLFEKEWSLNTKKNKEIISIWKSIRWKIINLFWDNEELIFEDKVSIVENDFKNNFWNFISDNWDFENNFKLEDRTKNINKLKDARNLRNEIKWYVDWAFINKWDEEFERLNKIYKNLQKFTKEFIDFYYKNEKEDMLNEAKAWVVLNNTETTFQEKYDEWKKHWEKRKMFDDIIKEKDDFDKIKWEKNWTIDEILSVFKIKKEEVEEFWINSKEYTWIASIGKHVRWTIWKLVLAWSLVYWWFSWLSWDKKEENNTSLKKEKVEKIILDKNISENNNSDIVNDKNNTILSDEKVNSIIKKVKGNTFDNNISKKNLELVNIDKLDFSKDFLKTKFSVKFLKELGQSDRDSKFVKFYNKIILKKLWLEKISNDDAKKVIKNLQEIIWLKSKQIKWDNFWNISRKALINYLYKDNHISSKKIHDDLKKDNKIFKKIISEEKNKEKLEKKVIKKIPKEDFTSWDISAI